MTDQQKKAVEEAIKKKESIIIKSSFRLGAEEVLYNTEKYGLIDSQSYYTAIRSSADLKEENTRLRSALKQIAEDKKEEYLNATDDVRLKAISILAKGALKGGDTK